jgi:hypothetical protein
MIYTDKIIDWLDKERYSRDHWTVVSTEMMEKAGGDESEAIKLLAESLRSFHMKYRDAVVKQDNVLHDLLTDCLELVDWVSVAKSRYTTD